MAIQFLRGTKSKVAASTRVLAEGQPLYETDTKKLKVGDGSTQAKSLPYVKVDTDISLSSTSTNPVQNKVVTTALKNKLGLSGGTLTGDLHGKYLCGTWLQTTDVSNLGKTPPAIAVLDSSGWIYKRAPAEILEDIGVPEAIQAAIGDAIAGSY